MNDFERQLITQMNDRSQRVNVTLDVDAIKSGAPRSNVGPDVGPDVGRWLSPRLLAAAAAIFLVGAGVVALTQLRTNEDPSDVAQPPAPLDPFAGLPREGPLLTDHWHVPYGINICGEWTELEGDLEEMGDGTRVPDGRFAATGIHSHDDGLMHIHPFGSAGTGPNATLGTFLGNYGVELTDDTLSFPPNQADGREVSESFAECGGNQASLSVIVWPDPADTAKKVIVTEHLADTPLGADGIVVTVAFTDDPASIEMPPSVVDAEANSQTGG